MAERKERAQHRKPRNADADGNQRRRRARLVLLQVRKRFAHPLGGERLDGGGQRQNLAREKCVDDRINDALHQLGYHQLGAGGNDERAVREYGDPAVATHVADGAQQYFGVGFRAAASPVTTWAVQLRAARRRPVSILFSIRRWRASPSRSVCVHSLSVKQYSSANTCTCVRCKCLR